MSRITIGTLLQAQQLPGFTGSQGDLGYSGSVGYTGSQGIPGEAAAIGYTGSQGAQGSLGYTGSQGQQGTEGYTGSQGLQGIAGVDGYTGSQGLIGYSGSQGTTGYAGSQGIPGEFAALGYTGSQGIAGDLGASGATGPIGYTGSSGQDGTIGVDGYTGSQGIQGDIGYTGSSGSGNSNVISATNDVSTNSNFYPVFVESAGNVEIVKVSTDKLYFNPNTGTLNSTSFNTLSDENIKGNIKTLENSLTKILAMRGVSFTWKDNNQKSIGVIAQEIEKIVPEIVNTNENGKKSVAYDSIIGLLIEAIKEQQNQINEIIYMIKETK